MHAWTHAQRKWLDRLAKQLTHEVELDRDLINRSFSTHGGFKLLDTVLDHHLNEVLEVLNDTLREVS